LYKLRLAPDFIIFGCSLFSSIFCPVSFRQTIPNLGCVRIQRERQQGWNKESASMVIVVVVIIMFTLPLTAIIVVVGQYGCDRREK